MYGSQRRGKAKVVSISAPTFEDKTISGSQAFSVKFTANRWGISYFCDATIIQHGANSYLMFLNRQQGTPPEPLEKILGSVKFKS
jgi:hypothetical protein